MHCGSLERHRLLWLYLKKKTDFFDGKPKKVLHRARESCLEPKFRRHLDTGYITADLANPVAMVKMDIMDIAFPSQTFDVIYCSHVLEHVADDGKAMRELHRFLKPDGWAILLVPILAEKTFEDPTIVDPEARLQAFGQSDHVRSYGPDYIDRLREAGCEVEVTRVEDLVTPSDARLMGLGPHSGEIYFCTK
jgi:SAM-dependent methyltransferase